MFEVTLTLEGIADNAFVPRDRDATLVAKSVPKQDRMSATAWSLLAAPLHKFRYRLCHKISVIVVNYNTQP